MNWWLRLWRRGRLEKDLDKELRFHVDACTSDLVARGVDPIDARRRALLMLGGREQIKEACRDVRGTRFLEELIQDARYAVRMLDRMPGVTAIALLVLALGIGATTVMFTVIESVLLKPLALPEPERLVALQGANQTLGEFWRFSNPDLADLTRESRVLQIAGWSYSGGTISQPGEPEHVDARQISPNLFAVLGVPLARGRAFRSDEDRRGAAPVAIISHRLWERRYSADSAAIGDRLVFDGRPYTVVGIAPDGFDLDGDADVFTPLGQSTDRRMENREARFIRAVARLRPNATMAAAEAEVGVMGRRLAREYPASNDGLDLRLRPLQRDVVGDVGSILWLLLSAVVIVLLIACVNIASLLLARAASRLREFAMRAALGASRSRLVRQCLTESAVLAAAGAGLGALVAAFAVRPFIALWPGSLPRAAEIRLDSHVWLFTIAMSVVSSAVFGLVPALRIQTRGLDGDLRSGGRSITGQSRSLHSAFVVAELALAVVLLVSAGVLGRSLLALSNVDPGLNVHNVLTGRFALSPGALGTPERIRAGWRDVLDRARRVPGVESAALADIIPMRGGVNTLPYSASATLPPSNEGAVALASAVTPDYLPTMEIPLRRGRFFDAHDDQNGELVLVVDETLAEHAFGKDDPVGKRLWVPAMGPLPLHIIGVVGHVRHWGLAGDDASRVRDQMYYPFAQVPAPLLRLFSSFMSVAVRTRVPPMTVEQDLRQQLRGASGDQALYDVQTMEHVVGASLDRQRFLALLFGIFAGVAALLACLGIYGVLAYVTRLRVPEFGVRIALGATSRDLVRLVLRQSVSMIAAGAAIGGAGAWAAGRLIARFVEGVRPTQPSTFVAMISLLAAAALLASVIPARRASRLDPLQALRQD